MKKRFPDLPAWYFCVDEVSAGVYEVIGRDDAGNVVSAKGIDPNSLSEQCRIETRKSSMRRPQRTK
jgi:hypothetical protein